MLIHNKRLHPRRSCEPDEHYHGCMLHDMEEIKSNTRRSISPLNRSTTPSSQYSSLSSSSQKRHRNKSESSNHSVSYATQATTPQPIIRRSTSITSTSDKRNSIGAYPTSYDTFNGLFSDVLDAPDASKTSFDNKINKSIRNDENVSSSGCDRSHRQKSKSTICLNSALITAGESGRSDRRHHTVTFKCYDSPDEIIANLFPGIDDKEITFLRKGHGAAQMIKQRSNQKDWQHIMRSTSASGNYATATATTDKRKSRSNSTSSDNNNSNNKIRYRPHSYAIGSRLYSIERDFGNLWWVFLISDKAHTID